MQQQRPSPASLGFVYFGIGFTVSATLLMIILAGLRPFLGDLGSALRIILMLMPPIFGLIYGARVAFLGVRDGLRLGGAMRRGLGLHGDDDHWPEPSDQ